MAQPKHPQPNYGAAGGLGCPARPVLRPANLLPQSGRHDDRQVPVQGGSSAHVHQAADVTGIPVNVPLMPEYFKKAGYMTHAIGKWHLGFCHQNYTPTYRGFDSFYGFYNGAQVFVGGYEPQ